MMNNDDSKWKFRMTEWRGYVVRALEDIVGDLQAMRNSVEVINKEHGETRDAVMKCGMEIKALQKILSERDVVVLSNRREKYVLYGTALTVVASIIIAIIAIL